MILAATLAALAGLALARRAFFQQLRLNEMKSNFVSSVSHELRAPIASVRLMAENLERGKIPEARRQGEYFHFIVQECRRLSSLIENVLDFSRIEQGRKEYEFEPSDVIALARTTVKLLEPYAAEKGVKLETSGLEPGAANIELNVDGRALQQALVNLIDNAIKHSPKGEAVTVGMERRDGPAKAVHLYVADHGPGIAKEEHEKIFERFYRCGSELRRQTQGVGIGLSVVRHVVAAHGGRVLLQSELGHGSRFTIELPERSHHA
jgi:signal transduction histidine kinase